MSNQLQPAHIRSFHARRGRRVARAGVKVQRLWPDYGIDASADPLDLAEHFGARVPVVLEIGFGLGDATAEMAAADPTTGLLAVDVHTPGVGQLLARIENDRLTNVRIIHDDAVEVIRDRLPPQSLAGIRVFFPDPWPKNRHHKRRLIQADFVALAADRLVSGGFIHLATDWADYAHQMASVLTAEPLLIKRCAGSAPRPRNRPLTKYEAVGLAQGRTITDLIYQRV